MSPSKSLVSSSNWVLCRKIPDNYLDHHHLDDIPAVLGHSAVDKRLDYLVNALGAFDCELATFGHVIRDESGHPFLRSFGLIVAE